MDHLLEQLISGDFRTIGASNHVAQALQNSPEKIPQIVDHLTKGDPHLRMRCADTLEKVGANNPNLLQPYKHHLLSVAQTATQKEIQWHLAQIISYLELSKHESTQAYQILSNYYHTTSSNIVKVFSLTTLSKLQLDSSSQAQVNKLINAAKKSSIPSLKARAKKLTTVIAKTHDE